MAKVSVNCKIRTYPDFAAKGTSIEVKNHWNYDGKVHLIIGEEHHIVIADDLITAVERCIGRG